MRVLVVGASGLLGSAISVALSMDGHEVIGATRSGRPSGLARAISIDMRTARAEDWLRSLQGIDTVINCAGVLQDISRDSTNAAHADGPAELFSACEAAGVRKVIHFSAIGMDRETPTAFSQSKARGDAALQASDLDWVILRPSVVVGQSAYGGSALFRGLAALPILPELKDAGEIQVVQLSDVVATVRFFLQSDAPTRLALELAGPERLAFAEVVGEYRAWFGWRPARRIRLPQGLMRAVFAVGDFAGWLGWRPPGADYGAYRNEARGGRGPQTLDGQDRHQASLTASIFDERARQRAGEVVRESIPAQAGDLRNLLDVLDRHSVHVAWAWVGYRHSLHE